MKLLNYSFIVLCISVLFCSCTVKEGNYKLNVSKKTILGSKATVNLEELSNEPIDSIQLFIGDKKCQLKNNSVSVDTKLLGVGSHDVTALVFLPNRVEKVKEILKVYADSPRKLYSYKLVNTYPHDKESYTQGLEFYNGYLYETTGRIGTSWLRKLDYKTGEVLQQMNLKDYFGEGMTIANGTLYWLTWQGGLAFTFDPETFKKKGDFKYNQKSIEGWGLTHSPTHLIKSDGSNKLFFLDFNGKEQYTINAYTVPLEKRESEITKLNEIEYVDGDIYANIWQTNSIAVIDSKTGVFKAVINLSELTKEILKEQKLTTDQVLNGIAYNPETKTFFVTGKQWGKLFEIQIIK